MKYLFVLLVTVTFIFTGCRGQENKTVSFPKNEKHLSFEEKQKQALRNDQPGLINSAVAAFNFRYAAKKATPGVVHIKSVFPLRAEREMPDFFRDFFGDDLWRQYFSPDSNIPQIQTSNASGVIVSDDGYIVTNNHVVSDAENIEVVLHDQRSYKARIIGTDPATDLALLKIDGKNLSFIEFGNSDSVEVGDFVLAVGNPFNLASTVTAGIVSAKARNINILTDKSAVESYIQTDAAVNRGNSGGALVDINGKLIGINAAIATPTGAFAGYSFAIPVEIVKKIIDDLLQHGKVLRGYLGVIITDMNGEKAKTLGISTTTGVMVDSLQQNSAAMQAGIQTKDVITKIDDRTVETATQLREIIARHRPGEKLQLTVIRNGMEKIISVTLKASEEKIAIPTAKTEVLKKLGIEVETILPEEKIKFKISGGVRVKNILKGKIYSYTSIHEGFIITKVNGNPVNTTEDFIKELEGKKEGIMLEGIYPGYSGVYYYAFGMD
jgi:serine protease Do